MPTIQIRHEYRVFSEGVFLGLLPDVTSDFDYTQDINTPGTDISIDVALSLDTASETPEIITTEDGRAITTESGYALTTERSKEVVGIAGSGALIANDNDIEVYEISDNYPNGTLVFSGYMSRWRTVGSRDRVTVTCLSYGKDLDDYIYGNISTTIRESQTTTNSDIGFWSTRRYGQAFTTAVGQTDLVQIRLSLAVGSAGPKTFTVRIWNNTSEATLGGTPLASVAVIVSNTAYEEIIFQLSDALTVASNTTYFFSLEIDSSSISSDSTTWGAFQTSTTTAPPSGGIGYRSSSGAAWSALGEYLLFKTYSGTLLVDATFTGADPSDMVTEAVDSYNSQGGVVTYTGSSIEATGLAVDYEFKMATILEQIRKDRELAGANWYWYVNPATQVLYFKETPTTATHFFIMGRHLEEFSFEASVEDIVNVVYFTGGPTAGVNLLKKYTDDTSLGEHRRGMQRISDNRIDAAKEPSAQLISENFMDENSEEEYMGSPITILADTYDITTIHPGDTVTVQGFNSFIDDTIFQITRLKRNRRYAQLTLGKLPLISSTYVDQIKRNLDKVVTLDNPDTPS